MQITTTSKLNKGAVHISFTKNTDTTQINLSSSTPTIIIGIKDAPTKFTLPLIIRKIARTAKSTDAINFSVDITEWLPLSKDIFSEEKFIEQFAYELVNASYDFEKYKKEVKKQTLNIITHNKKEIEIITRGLLIADELNSARELVNTPGSHLSPDDLAKHAITSAKGIANVSVNILDNKKMASLKMNAILAVGESSPNKPKFIIMEYKGNDNKKQKAEKPIVFIGKGVTFDTGGSNLKPGDHMNGMHMDMAGGAIAIHTLLALSKLKIKKNIIALIPAVENRVTGESYLPGDVIVGMSGKPIEVLNTDAEGRVILSDALTYAKKYNPEVVIDLATLTGAAVVALGSRVSAVFSNSDKLANELKTIGEETKNLMWPMPLYDEYKQDIKGDLGGVTNTHNKFKRDGGAITGAMFLEHFVEGYTWAHIDIAPRMESISGDNLANGATAEPLYALVSFVINK
ncbi:MAG: leucyl aminopeptidase family protein [Candidatus Nomurabacteria bacterium]